MYYEDALLQDFISFLFVACIDIFHSYTTDK